MSGFKPRSAAARRRANNLAIHLPLKKKISADLDVVLPLDLCDGAHALPRGAPLHRQQQVSHRGKELRHLNTENGKLLQSIWTELALTLILVQLVTAKFYIILYVKHADARIWQSFKKINSCQA